jgi:exopolysaccharide biosynthesis polyprenyl glycosylphosphotransferase
MSSHTSFQRDVTTSPSTNGVASSLPETRRSFPGQLVGTPAGAGSRGRSTLVPIAEARGPAGSRRRDALFRRSLAGADVIAVLAAYALMIDVSAQALRLTWALPLTLPLALLGGKLFGLYDRDASVLRKTTLDELPRLVQAATLYTLVGWLTGGLVVGDALTRRDGLVLWIALALLLVLLRATARALALRLAPAERCLFVGDRASGEAIASKLRDHCGVRAEVVAHVDLDQTAPWSADATSSRKLAEIRDLAQSLDVHRAIVAPRSADAGEMLDLVRTLKAVGLRVSVLPRLLEVVGSAVEFDDLHGVTLMGLRRFELTRSSALAKRALDVLGAALGLLAVAPLMALIAVAIKLDSRGPVFFRQLRVGQHGTHFQMLKFRTMVPEAEALKESLRDRNEAQDGLFKIADDPRITRVGRILRKSALDELPQLVNVLRGEMSLVGPRPLVTDEDERVEGWHRRRLELTPGMTGYWQILGPARVPLREMVAIDYLYVANWSLWTDVKIMLRTVPHVIGRKGL